MKSDYIKSELIVLKFVVRLGIFNKFIRQFHKNFL